MPIRGAFTGAGFVFVFDVLVFVVPVVLVDEPVVAVPELFFFVLSAPVLGRGRLRLVFGAVFVFCVFSFGRDTRNAPRTSSWSRAAIDVAAKIETIAQAKRMNKYFMSLSPLFTALPQVYCVEYERRKGSDC
jgi:hypothetical protein